MTAASTQALLRLRGRPLAFLMHHMLRHRTGHLVVLGAVFIAVVCSVCTQYGMKNLIDVVARGPGQADTMAVWAAFGALCLLITADNLFWRIGGWAAARAFVAVSGDVRSGLFGHLANHSPSYFAERLPGTLASRITATSNAIFQIENTGAWNVLPPCMAVAVAITLITFVNPLMAVALVVASVALGGLIFVLARRGTPLHRNFASAAAAVDGELVDVLSNMGVVRAFGATFREHSRVCATVGAELDARRRSLFYLEKLRLTHAVVTAIMTAGLLAWGVVMWQHGRASAGDMVLICSLGITILHSTRDLAVALVDLTQHVARLDEAIGALLVPHQLPDAPNARDLRPDLGRVQFDGVRFAYPGRAPILNGLDLHIRPGERIGLVGASGAGKSTVISLLQRFYDIDDGRILVDGQDIRTVRQNSLREMLSIVPQDISLFHRSVLENIRYARPEASEAEVMAAADAALRAQQANPRRRGRAACRPLCGA